LNSIFSILFKESVMSSSYCNTWG